MSILTLENISKTYRTRSGQLSVLHSVCFSAEPGEFVAIVGQSGSGKSTLLNCAGCLDLPTEGTVRINGQNTAELDDRALSDLRNCEIGFIFQAYNLLPGLTALENVELPLRYRGFSRRECRLAALEALESVGLHNRLSHYPSQLSGGQQQRIAAARALVGKPSLLLADEPTGNLDPDSAREMLRLLTSRKSDGQALLLITHDERIAALADRVCRLVNGRLLPA